MKKKIEKVPVKEVKGFLGEAEHYKKYPKLWAMLDYYQQYCNEEKQSLIKD